MPTEPTKAKPAKAAEPKSKQPAAKETPAEPTEPTELYCNQCGESTPALYLHEKLTMLVCADCAAGNDPEAEPVDAAEPTDDDDVEKAAATPRLAVATETPVLAQQEFLKSAHSSAKRIAYGVAYPVYGPGEADSQSDTMSPEEIEKAAHKFMVESRAYDMHHTIFDLGPNDAAVVESYIAPVDLTLQDMYGEDKLIRKGSWVVATKFGEAVWDSVLKGELNAYSIRGVGKRAPVTT